MKEEEKTQRRVWEEFPENYPSVEFRLIYEGPLKAAGGGRGGTRSPEKHAIRKQLHRQLARLWDITPELQRRKLVHDIPSTATQARATGTAKEAWIIPAARRKESLLETLGNNFNRCGYKFVPLVSNELKLSCGLDILFLRRDMPGVPLIHSGGDIDNRLKVLFDALRVPENCNEVGGAEKSPDEEPYFFCLLEDDALITDVSVTTDTLLTQCDQDRENDVHLVIKVRVRPTEFLSENLAFVP